METQLFETGATDHAVNDLILFTDNTRELSELRDNIYKKRLVNFRKGSRHVLFNLGNRSVFSNGYHYGWRFTIKNVNDRLLYDFQELREKSAELYIKEFPNFEDHKHVKQFSPDQINEFCQLYADDFENWKIDHIQD